MKLEVVCTDQDTDRLVKVVQQVCRSGASGDGMIFVTEVSQAVRIRDGVRGEAAL